MQLSPEDQKRIFGKDKLKTAYQRKKRSLCLNRRVKRVHITSMSDDKDDLKSIKVYKFDNIKEKWHEFALKFRVIADTRDYWGIIDGSVVPPDELATITVTAEDTGEALKEKKEKLKARTANKMGYRDLVMSTQGISLTIVENAVSEELTKGDLKKAWERLERRWNPKTREDKVEVYTKFLNYKLENTRQRPMDWIAFMEKKRSELMNTGHIMSDEMFITHLLNSLPQTVYEGAILVIKDKLRKGTVEITEIEQILEDKFQAIKQAKGWEEEEDDYALFASPPSKKGPKKAFKGDRIPSTTPGAEPPRDARDSGSARSHSTHLETSSSDRPKWSPTRSSTRYQDQISVTCTRWTLRMPSFTRATHAQPSLSNFTRRDSNFGERTRSRGTTLGERNFPTSPQNKKTKLTHCSIYVPMRTISTSHAK